MKMKKILAAVLAATMVLANGLTVFAAGSGSAAPAQSSDSAKSSSEKSGSSEESGSSEGSGNSEESSSSTEAVISTIQTAGATISVAGTNVKTAVAGSYAAKSVQGVAFTGSLQAVKAELGLNGNQTPYVMVFDTSAKKSPKAMDCVNAAVSAMGDGKVVTALNVDLGIKEKGKFVRLEKGTVGMMVGLPKGVNTSKPVSVVCVRPGGKVTILKDTDSNPNTVTFEVYAGLGTYAIVTQ